MKVVIIFLSIIAFIICLLIGVYVGSMEPTVKTPTPSHPISSSRTPTPPKLQNKQTPVQTHNYSAPLVQRTLVLIQSDDLKANHPRLIGIWLAFYFTTQPQIIFLPLYPPEPGGESPQSEALADSFGFTPQGALTLAFEQALQAYNFQYDGYMITDHEGLARIVDGLHGIDLGDGSGIRDGKTVSGSLAFPWVNPGAALTSQKRLLNGFCKRWADNKEPISWITLIGTSVPDHIRTNLSIGIFVDDWNALTSLAKPIKCEIPAIN
jgi:hypothetical protein